MCAHCAGGKIPPPHHENQTAFPCRLVSVARVSAPQRDALWAAPAAVILNQSNHLEYTGQFVSLTLRIPCLLADGTHAMSGTSLLLSAILSEIGASEYLKAFTDDDQDDECIGSYKNAEKISKNYGMPQPLASALVEMCRALVIVRRLMGASATPLHLTNSTTDSLVTAGTVPQSGSAAHTATVQSQLQPGHAPPPSRAESFSPSQPAPATGYNSSPVPTTAAPLPPPNGSGGGAVPSHPQQPIPSPSRGNQPPPAADGQNNPSLLSRIPSFFNGIAASLASDPRPVGVAADTQAIPGARAAPNQPSNLQLAIGTSVSQLPQSYSEYIYEMPIDHFTKLTQQLICVPPLDRIAVGSCHRLPSRSRERIRLGSSIIEISLLNLKSVVIQVTN